MSDITPQTPITIVLCTHNGAAHLEAQLHSYLRQTHTAWSLWVSDDGSCDGTAGILRAFAAAHGRERDIRLLRGPGRGAAANFLSTLCHPDLPAGFVALSDQDDVWRPGKLSRALTQIARVSPGLCDPVPLIYGAQSVHTDSDLLAIGGSALPGRAVGFGNALVQNMISGHSCVLSPAAVALVRRTGVPREIPYHDWWLYQLVTGTGGRALVDEARVLLYRQHARNVLGAHRGLRAHLARLGMILGRRYGDWIGLNLAALAAREADLSPEARAIVTALRDDPARRGLARVQLLRRHGIHRQTRSGDAVLALAAFFGRI